MASEALPDLLAVRQHQRDGQRSPHKPLLILLALGHLAATGSSELAWSSAAPKLGELLAEFGPPSRTSPAQSAAYPFTRLRSDHVWTLSHDVPMDLVAPLNRDEVIGRFVPEVEEQLRPDVIHATARAIVEAEFPASLVDDVLAAVGFDADQTVGPVLVGRSRRRTAGWPAQVLAAWDRQCAFCGYDGQLGMGSVGLEAAHVRWFNFEGPDQLDNGLALCALHHKLFDRGALGLSDDCRIQVSASFSARTDAGRRIYELDGKRLLPRPGTLLPAGAHIEWHSTQVFKGKLLTG
ncbi:MAG: HNH endonuclease [Propionibacteriaceae bacterium]|nr:HNH endonuclease [Propionibacteriaceae bacterium]